MKQKTVDGQLQLIIINKIETETYQFNSFQELKYTVNLRKDRKTTNSLKNLIAELTYLLKIHVITATTSFLKPVEFAK